MDFGFEPVNKSFVSLGVLASLSRTPLTAVRHNETFTGKQISHEPGFDPPQNTLFVERNLCKCIAHFMTFQDTCRISLVNYYLLRPQ